MKSTVAHLDLYSLKLGAPCLTATFCDCLGDAAAKRLEDQGHLSGATLYIDGHYNACFSLVWEPISEQVRATWNDNEVCTEHGAYCLAMIIIKQFEGFEVVERSKKGSGFDYWIGKRNGQGEQDKLPFQDKARLEVSGIANGGERDIAKRVQGKLKQTNPSDYQGLPAYIVVVEFSRPVSRVVLK